MDLQVGSQERALRDGPLLQDFGVPSGLQECQYYCLLFLVQPQYHTPHIYLKLMLVIIPAHIVPPRDACCKLNLAWVHQNTRACRSKSPPLPQPRQFLHMLFKYVILLPIFVGDHKHSNFTGLTRFQEQLREKKAHQTLSPPNPYRCWWPRANGYRRDNQHQTGACARNLRLYLRTGLIRLTPTYIAKYSKSVLVLFSSHTKAPKETDVSLL